MTDYKRSWNSEDPIKDLGIDVPAWIDQDIYPSTVAAIVQGGCASGAYMPAVTYYDAQCTMGVQGDDILQYLQDSYGELPKPKDDESWSGLAVFYLSCGVELWTSGVIDEIESKLEENDDD